MTKEKDGSKVVYTNNIPQCPYCQKPTKRNSIGQSSTCMYYPPKYNEKGINTNPDRNTITSVWHCDECKKGFAIKGNEVDGFNYSLK